MANIVLKLLGSNGVRYKAILPTSDHYLITEYHLKYFSDYRLIGWKCENIILSEPLDKEPSKQN